MDGGRLIKPMVSVAVRRLAAGGPTMRIEGELVMSHRDLVTVRALWLDRRGRSGLGDRGEAGGEPHESDDRQKTRDAFHVTHPRWRYPMACSRAREAPLRVNLNQNTGSPGAISASGASRITSERAFFAPRISTSD